jgi:hypothetical protein
MNDDGSGLEQCSELIEMIKRFPTAAFVAGRLKAEGCESDYRKSLLDEFREDLIQECGDELSEVLEYFSPGLVQIAIAQTLEGDCPCCEMRF